MAHISEVSYAGATPSDFVEVALPEGTDAAGWSVVIYNNGGNPKKTLDFGTPEGSGDGRDIYLFEQGDGLTGLNANDAIALIDGDGQVLQFVSFEGHTVTATKGPAAGEISTDIGAAGRCETLQTGDGGATYAAAPTTRGTVPCFAPGTRILTPEGWRPVETLREGDAVCTLDAGPQPVAWTRAAAVPIGPKDAGWPILLRAGAFGPQKPARDLILSGQHKVLVGPGAALAEAFARQCLAPVKALTGLPRIREMRGVRQMTWHHFALDRHAVVVAERLAVESLYLGPMVLEGLPRPELVGLRRRFGPPDERGALNGPPARPFLSAGQARRSLTGAGQAAA